MSNSVIPLIISRHARVPFAEYIVAFTYHITILTLLHRSQAPYVGPILLSDTQW